MSTTEMEFEDYDPDQEALKLFDQINAVLHSHEGPKTKQVILGSLIMGLVQFTAAGVCPTITPDKYEKSSELTVEFAEVLWDVVNEYMSKFESLELFHPGD